MLVRMGSWSATILGAVTVMACSRGPDRAANDSSRSVDSLRVDTSSAVPRFREWMAGAGRYLLIASASPETALVVFPEFTIDTTLAGVQFTASNVESEDYSLFAPDGGSTIGRLTTIVQERRPGCENWPLSPVIRRSAEAGIWTIGLRAGGAHGIPYLALDRLPSRDSAQLVVALTRLASQAPNDTVAALRGLPYVVRSAYRATLADSQAFVFGELVRRVNIEASPHEERTTIIGERPLESEGTPFVLVYSERHTGDEESVPTTDLIGLVQLRDGTSAAFGARDFSDGGTFVMFERQRGPRWRLRWQSAYAGC